MDEWLALAQSLSAPGLIGVWVIMLWTGRFYTRAQYLELKADRDYWREAARTNGDAVKVHAATTAQSLEYQRLVDQFISSLPRGGGHE